MAMIHCYLPDGFNGIDEMSNRLLNGGVLTMEEIDSIRDYWRDGGNLVECGSGGWVYKSDLQRMGITQVRVYANHDRRVHLLTLNK